MNATSDSDQLKTSTIKTAGGRTIRRNPSAKFKCAEIGLSKMRKTDKLLDPNSQRGQLAQITGLGPRYRPLLANGDTVQARKRYTDSHIVAMRLSPTSTDPNGGINGKITGGFSRQKKQKLGEADLSMVQLQSRERVLADLPDLSKSNLFEWSTYLKDNNFSTVPCGLFNHVPFDVPIPNSTTPSGLRAVADGSFKPGQFLEGIDPHNESLFCALSVVELVGRRVRLRFVGYAEKYDFWTTVDSPFLFPIGWCAHNGRQLQPPKSFLDPQHIPFSWTNFLNREEAKAVPRCLFRSPWDSPFGSRPSHPFHVGLKLEAVDKRNPAVACVATVKDCIGDYILVHFDGWDSGFDQWAHITSELLHPVGFCEQQEQVLSVPSEWNNRPGGFTWERYLKETNSDVVPREAFEKPSWPIKLSQQYQPGFRLEAVDKRCPSLIRVAHVVSNSPPGFLTIGYDGWPEKYNVCVELKSFDLFPVGYCHSTAHALQVPPGYESEMDMNGTSTDAHSNSSTSSISAGPNPTSGGGGGGGCPTPGCKGYGHIKGPRFYSHQRISGCPYADMNLKKDPIRAHERLSFSDIIQLGVEHVKSSTSASSSPCQTPLCNATTPTQTNRQRLSPDSTIRTELSLATNVMTETPGQHSMESSHSTIEMSTCSMTKSPSSPLYSSANVHSNPADMALTTTHPSPTNLINESLARQSPNTQPYGLSGPLKPVFGPVLKAPAAAAADQAIGSHASPPLLAPHPNQLHNTLPLDLSVDKIKTCSPGSDEEKYGDHIVVVSTSSTPIMVSSVAKDSFKFSNTNSGIKSPVTPTLDTIKHSGFKETSTPCDTYAFDASMPRTPLESTPIGFNALGSESTTAPTKLPKLDEKQPFVHENKPFKQYSSHISDPQVDYIKQQQQQFGGTLGNMPIKRKRGRPRKYSTIHMVHSPTHQSSRPVHFNNTQTTMANSRANLSALSYSYPTMVLSQQSASAKAIPTLGQQPLTNSTVVPIYTTLNGAATVHVNTTTSTTTPLTNGTVFASSILPVAPHEQPVVSTESIRVSDLHPNTSSQHQQQQLNASIITGIVTSQSDSSPVTVTSIASGMSGSICPDAEPSNIPSTNDHVAPIQPQALVNPTASLPCLPNNSIQCSGVCGAVGGISVASEMPTSNWPPESVPHNSITLDPCSPYTFNGWGPCSTPAVVAAAVATANSCGGTGLGSMPLTNPNPIFVPSQRLLEPTITGWCPDPLMTGSFVPLNNPIMRPQTTSLAPSQFYLDSSRPACLLSSFDMFNPSQSSNCIPNIHPNGLSSIADNDLMGRLLPQASAALRAARVAGLPGPHLWNPEVVANFVATLPGCKQFASRFTENEIDGAAFLCLEQHDLMQVLGMKLGPAVKVSSSIQALRRNLMATPVSELGPDHATVMSAAASCFNKSTVLNHSKSNISDSPTTSLDGVVMVSVPASNPCTNTSSTSLVVSDCAVSRKSAIPLVANASVNRSDSLNV